jgi:hypothetical protein
MAFSSVLAMVGCSSGNSPSSGSNATATPTFSPGAGSYNASQTVTIATTTPGAVLYCTTDGTMPTSSSPQCSQPTTVFKSEFLQAIAVVNGAAPSAVASAGYTINLNATPTPTFNPAGGSYAAAQNVTISDTAKGANIYYTLDGSVPTVNSTLYTGPIAISKSTTLSAIATATGFSNSGVQSATYVVGQGVATPVITPAGGTFNAATPVTITDATAGAIIYYTVDGSTPSASSTPYTGSISVATNETINAIAVTPNGSSSVATASFTISVTAAAPPTFSPAAGTFSSTQTVMLSDATPGATIFYTVDGSMPTTSSPQYNASGISVATSETIKAIATAPGFGASAVSSAAYTINVTVASPTFSPAAGTYMAATTVTLSDATAGATIYYTTDGSSATTSSPQYIPGTTVITVSSPTDTINAIAAVGSTHSTMATAVYTINLGPSYSGTVMSGTLPVNGAKVQMYAAGNSGYASSATQLTTASATTGSDGTFTLNYNCPSAPGDLVYLVATGGSTGTGASNAALGFMAALGSCNGTLPKTAVVNEATTVASAYALAQFMTAAANVGSSAANYEQGTNTAPGLANAFATAKNLVDLTTGQVLDHTPDYPTNLAGDTNILNNSTVPQSRINTLANTLNACAADGSACSSLFSAATPPSGTAPADTLQAILNIAQNPGKNVGTVYNVTAGGGPFTPALSGAPNDWTLALTYTGGGLGFAPSLPLQYGSGASVTPGQFVNSAMAIDATGNIWITGYVLNSSLVSSFDLTSGMVAQFNNQGKPLTPASTFTTGSPSTHAYGGYIAYSSPSGNAGTIAAHALAIDPSGNAWVSGGNPSAGGGVPTGAMSEIGPDLSLKLQDVQLGPITSSPLAIDGVGNIWLQSGNGFEAFNSSGGVQVAPDPNHGVNQPLSPYGYSFLQSLIFDSNATSLWASDANGFGDFFQINPGTNTATVDYSVATPAFQYTSLVAGSADPTTGNAGNVYGCADTGGQKLDVFNVSSTSLLAAYTTPTTRGCGHQMAMDGAGHIFAVTGGTAPGIVDEFTVTSSGVTGVSPATGYTGTGIGEAPTVNPDPNAPVVNLQGSAIATGSVMGTAIDGSGNLWVLNENTGSTASPGNALVEFIGIAAPVVTPTSRAIQFGQVGVKP